MLENILSEINSNLVRIANALESKKEKPEGVTQIDIQPIKAPVTTMLQTTNTESQVAQVQAPVVQQPTVTPQAIPKKPQNGVHAGQIASSIGIAVDIIIFFFSL